MIKRKLGRLKRELEINRRIDFDIEYDEKKYSIEYVREEGKILLKRLSDDKFIKIFDDNIGFILQIDKDGKTHFLVSTYEVKRERYYVKLLHYKLLHYIDEKCSNIYSNALELKAEFNIDSQELSDIRLSDSVFIIKRENEGEANLYNLKTWSKRFDKIYSDEKIDEIFGKNDKVAMVSKVRIAESNHQVCDLITYGINPETYEIVTPIWSEVQQRFIPIYTEEQLEEIEKKKYVKYGRYLNRKNYSVEEIMITLEIEHYLNKIAIYLDAPKSIYNNDNQINEEFVRGFIKK